MEEDVCGRCASCSFPGCPAVDDRASGRDIPMMELSDGTMVCGHYIPRRGEEPRKYIAMFGVWED